MSSGNVKPVSNRIHSLDQFRGYTIVGMFAVNFLGEYWHKHPKYFFHLEHHNTHFEYADSIMPSFFFAVGFGYRLSMLRRLAAGNEVSAYVHAVLRGLGLMLLSLMLLPPSVDGMPFKEWKSLQSIGAWKIVSNIIKGDLWETLALIGATSILVLPVIAARPSVRIAAMIAFAAIHVVIAQLFNFHSVHGEPNWLDGIWPQVKGKRSFDGGPFGLVMWAMPMLAGSLAYDAVSANARRAVGRLFGWGVAFMTLGYSASCVSTLYLVAPGDKAKTSTSPVIPNIANAAGRDAASFLMEPPFVQPPERKYHDNYWIMCKKQTTLSFMLFATGFAMALYSMFVTVADVGSLRIGLLRIFGQNALACYAIHEMVEKFYHSFAPADSPLWWVLTAFAAFFATTWLFVWHLDKNGIHLKL